MNKIAAAITILFFAGMVFLTAFSRSIHDSRLPHVEVIEIRKQDFTCAVPDDHGRICTVQRRAIGIPKDQLQAELYIVSEEEVFGEQRCFARKIAVMLDETYVSEEYSAVTSGVSIGDKLILPEEGLYDGCEVVIKKKGLEG